MCSTFSSFNTKLSADCVAWCPHPNYEHILACATYQLVENREGDLPNLRNGLIWIFQFLNQSLEMLSCNTTSGVLDIKWNPATEVSEPILGAAHSTGELIIYRLIYNEEGSLSLSVISSVRICEGGLSLYLDWNLDGKEVVITDSNGGATCVTINEHFNLILTKKIKSHQFEAWVGLYDTTNSNIIFTGGDDCKLKMITTEGGMSILKSSDYHSMGVTALGVAKRKANILLSGSYDEKLVCWDVRSFKAPLSSLEMGGGVWRCVWHPTKDLVLCSCMHNGHHIVDTTNLSKPEVIHSYHDHKSLAYGADWCHGDPVVASVSFYDCLLNIWGVHEQNFQ